MVLCIENFKALKDVFSLLIPESLGGDTQASSKKCLDGPKNLAEIQLQKSLWRIRILKF